MNEIFEKWRGALIVSCQAPAGSPLAHPEMIAALAATAELNGAAGVRIDSPANISAVKARVKIPVLGIYKVVVPGSDVYITPTIDAARQISAAGADVLALDATGRRRPQDEKVAEIAAAIRSELKKTIAADVATFEEGLIAAEEIGFDAIITTLSGYTSETKHIVKPDFELVESLAARVKVPVICEGRLRTADDVRRAFECGAYAVVVGTAITGVGQLVQQFISAVPERMSKDNS